MKSTNMSPSFGLFFCYLLLSCTYINAQSIISGVVLLHDNSRIPYVNIGIAEEGIGTVSDDRGRFSISIPEGFMNSELTISAIGFKTANFPLSPITKEIKIFMEEQVYSVDEVVISQNKLNSKILGIKVESDNIQAGFTDNSLGAEIAIKMNVKRKETVYPNKLHFRLAENDCDSLFFRINFYEVKNGKPGKNITPKSIYLSTMIEKGDVALDLTQYNLTFDDDFFVSLEWLRDQCPRMTEKGINFSSALFKKMYYKQTSQAKWSKLSIAGVGIWLDVGYEK